MRAGSELGVEVTNLPPCPALSFRSRGNRWLTESLADGWIGIVRIVSIGKFGTIRKDCRNRQWPERVG